MELVLITLLAGAVASLSAAVIWLVTELRNNRRH